MLRASHLPSGDRAATVATIFNRGRYLELLVDSVPAWLSYIGPDRRYRFANKRYNDAFGWSGTDIVGMAVWEVVPEDVYAAVAPYLDQALAGHHVDFEGTMPDPNGEDLHFQAQYIPDIANGTVNGVFALVTDISPQKKTEEAVKRAHADLERRFQERTAKLKESERRFRRIFEDSQLGMVLVSPTRRIIDANRAFCSMLEYPKSELMRLSMEDMTHPDDVEASKQSLQAVFGRRARKRRMEKRYLSKSGKVIWANVTLSPVRDDDGSHGYSVALIEDITEIKNTADSLKVAQEQLRAFLDNSPDGILMKDMDGRFVIVNRVYEMWHGISITELTGKTVYQLYPKDLADRVTAQDQEVLAADCAVKFENEVPFQNGTRRLLEQVKFPIRDGTGQVIGLGAVNRDVTEARQAEAALQTSQRMESLGRLTGGVAHDFNNLLTIIIGNLELVLDAGDTKRDFRSSINGAIEAADKGAQLVQRLLSFSRNQTLAPKVVRVPDLIRQMKDMFRQTLREAVTIEFELPNDIWAILVDPAQLENALLNLAVNAGDAMPNGGTFRIEVSNIEMADDAADQATSQLVGDYVLLRVSDTGEGIPPEILARVMEPFFTTKESGKGTGLGLSTVHGFVTQSGGALKIDSMIGEGTCMSLYFPRASNCDVEDFDETCVQNLPKGNGELVLIVEDEPTLRNLIASQVASLGYNVMEVKDGPEAIKVAAAQAPVDLLLTDIILPNGMNGIEVAEGVKQYQATTKVLYMTGYAGDGSGVTVEPKYSNSVLKKPLRTAQIAQAITSALGEE